MKEYNINQLNQFNTEEKKAFAKIFWDIPSTPWRIEKVGGETPQAPAPIAQEDDLPF